MGIAKFDDGIPDNPKFIQAGPIASWLWFCGVLYCRRALTDGFIPKQKVPTLVVGLAQPYKHAAVLVTVSLWDEAMGGYQVHDYLDWNPSKATVEDYRRRDKERKHKQNPDRIPDGFQSGSGTDSERRGASHAGAKSKSASESTSEDRDLRGESAREGNPHHRPTNLVNGADLRLHGTHAWCDYERNLCVHYRLHDDFRKRTNRTEDELKAWYRATVDATHGQDVGDDVFDFWRNKFAAFVGTVTSKTTTARSRTSDTVDAGKEHLKRQLAEFAAEEGESRVKRPALES